MIHNSFYFIKRDFDGAIYKYNPSLRGPYLSWGGKGHTVIFSDKSEATFCAALLLYDCHVFKKSFCFEKGRLIE
jgi:hypothetical protein